MQQVRASFLNVTINIVTNATSRLYTAWTHHPNVWVHVVKLFTNTLVPRSIIMYEHALSVSSSNTLVLEDDLLIHPQAYDTLKYSLD